MMGMGASILGIVKACENRELIALARQNMNFWRIPEILLHQSHDHARENHFQNRFGTD
jgi:hypothetical protein